MCFKCVIFSITRLLNIFRFYFLPDSFILKFKAAASFLKVKKTQGPATTLEDRNSNQFGLSLPSTNQVKYCDLDFTGYYF